MMSITIHESCTLLIVHYLSGPYLTVESQLPTHRLPAHHSSLGEHQPCNASHSFVSSLANVARNIKSENKKKRRRNHVVEKRDVETKSPCHLRPRTIPIPYPSHECPSPLLFIVRAVIIIFTVHPPNLKPHPATTR